MSQLVSSFCTESEAEIVSAAIYPPIGVMRVGYSPKEFFIGPEVNQPIAANPGSYRDVSGALILFIAFF